MTIEWTDEDNRRALSEGWVFSERSDTGEIELQCVDDWDEQGNNIGSSPFQDDFSAWEFVVHEAANSTFHSKALAWLKQESPEEWFHVVNLISYGRHTAEEVQKVVAELTEIEEKLR